MPNRAVYKTTNDEYLDDAGHDPEALRDALERLKQAGSLEQVTRGLAGKGLQSDAADVYAPFAREQGADDFERVLKHGFRVAMELAIEKDLPIETFWVTAPGSDFELHVAEGRYSVLVFFFVSGKESRPYGSARAGSRSWVIRAGDRDDVHSDAPRTALDDGVVQIQVSGRSGAPKTELY
jgi:hypothetical protein